MAGRNSKAVVKPKTAARPGRKFPKFPIETRKLYLQQLNEEGLTRSEAAEAVGIDRKTVWQYRIAHPEFDELVIKAERGAIEVVEDALFQKAKKGDFKSMEFFLVNRASDRWGKGRAPEVPVDKNAPTWDSVKAAIVQALLEHPEAVDDVVRALEVVSR